MTEENKGDVVSETQQTEINDIIDDFVPAQSEQATTVEEAIKDGDKGEERTEEKTSEQVEEPVRSEESKTKEVKVEEKKSEGQTSDLIEGDKPITEQKPPTSAETKEETELERLKRENSELRVHLEDVATQTLTAQQPKKLTPEEQKVRQEQAARQVLTFLKDDDTFDEVMKSSVNFNALLTSVVNTAVAKTVQILPQITNSYVDTQLSTRLAVRDFYTDNDDLLPHKKYVGFVSNELFAKNPQQTLEENLKETEKEVRSRLKLARPEGDSHRTVQSGVGRTVLSNPGFVPSGGGGGRRSSVSTDRLSAEEKGIMDLIS